MNQLKYLVALAPLYLLVRVASAEITGRGHYLMGQRAALPDIHKIQARWLSSWQVGTAASIKYDVFHSETLPRSITDGRKIVGYNSQQYSQVVPDDPNTHYYEIKPARITTTGYEWVVFNFVSSNCGSRDGSSYVVWTSRAATVGDLNAWQPSAEINLLPGEKREFTLTKLKTGTVKTVKYRLDVTQCENFSISTVKPVIGPYDALEIRVEGKVPGQCDALVKITADVE